MNGIDNVGFMPSRLATHGPFCFVNTSDPRASNLTNAYGDPWAGAYTRPLIIST
jgi:hypothetical protein